MANLSSHTERGVSRTPASIARPSLMQVCGAMPPIELAASALLGITSRHEGLDHDYGNRSVAPNIKANEPFALRQLTLAK
jgi:hypothetical protein